VIPLAGKSVTAEKFEKSYPRNTVLARHSRCSRLSSRSGSQIVLTESMVRCHRHIALIEQSMQIRAEQEARYRANVRGLEHRQCLLSRNRTPPLIDVGDEHSERTLPQSLTNWAYPPLKGNLGPRRFRNPRRAHPAPALQHRLPELVSYRFVEVVGLPLNGLRPEVGRRWKPICFGEEEWCLKNDATDRALGPRIGGYASIALDASPHLIIRGRAVLFPETLPRPRLPGALRNA
jgi:hypothetical protein